MKTRVLPMDEWPRMESEHFPPLFPFLAPKDVAVVVVEDEAGRIIGSMTVMRAVHFEGAWIDPEHRNAGVTRALFKAAVEAANDWCEGWVFAGASDEKMRGVLDRLGAVKLPMDSYVLRFAGGRQCPRPS